MDAMRPLPVWAADAAHTRVEITVGWVDRLKVLFGATIRVRVEVFTEHTIGRAEGHSQVFVGRVFRRRANKHGYNAEAPYAVE